MVPVTNVCCFRYSYEQKEGDKAFEGNLQPGRNNGKVYTVRRDNGLKWMIVNSNVFVLD